jgi:hypothetical protein
MLMAVTSKVMEVAVSFFIFGAGTEPGASHMLSICSTTELPSPAWQFLKIRQ